MRPETVLIGANGEWARRPVSTPGRGIECPANLLCSEQRGWVHLGGLSLTQQQIRRGVDVTNRSGRREDVKGPVIGGL
jgi:hypothetical protein